MINNLNYLPDSIKKSLINNGGDQLKNLHFLPEMWDNPINNGKWNKLTYELKNNVLNKNKQYYDQYMEQALNQSISNFSAETQTMIKQLYELYYTGTFSPHIFGVYFDGKAFLEDIKKMNEAQVKQTTLNYWEAFTAVAMCGALDASLNNPKMQPLLQPITLNTNNRNKLRLVVNYMRIGKEFKALNKEDAEEIGGIGNQWWNIGIALLRHETKKYRKEQLEKTLGEKKEQLEKELVETVKDASGAYEFPLEWLKEKYEPEINKIEQMENSSARVLKKN